MPTSSAILASLRLSGQFPDQRSGTRVTARPDEQFAPNKPILSLFALCIDMRSCRDGAGASTVPPQASFDVPNVNQASVAVSKNASFFLCMRQEELLKQTNKQKKN